MTTFLFFAEMLVNTPKPSKTTDALYKGILKNSKSWYYTKWGDVSNNGLPV